MPSTVDSIRETWRVVDRHLAASLSAESRRGTNDCAYFLLLFARVETAVDRLYNEIVGFDAEDQVPFRRRLRLVSRFFAPGDARRVELDYELRCDIAHGRVGGRRLDLEDVASVYHRIESEIG